MSTIIRKLYTLVFVRDLVNEKVLLGLKKRGFGINKWNGMGGKVEPGESFIDCAKREVKEESGLEVHSLKQIAYLEFQFESKLNETLVAHVFSVDKYSGEICECDEMRPAWFKHNEIPYDQMWKDDLHWLPKVLDNKFVNAYFLFKDDEETIVKQEIQMFESHEEFIKTIKF